MTRTGRGIGPLLLMSAMLATACAHGPAVRTPDTAEVRAAIEGTLREFGGAMQRADAAAIGAMFTEDAEYITAATKGFISGRAAIEDAFRARFKAARFLDVAIVTVSLQVVGDTAYETGTNRLTFQAGDAPPVTRTGRYLSVWRRGADGVWRIRVDAIIPDPAS
jgi:uncharacterized protein (TIGR02246 family)